MRLLSPPAGSAPPSGASSPSESLPPSPSKFRTEPLPGRLPPPPAQPPPPPPPPPPRQPQPPTRRRRRPAQLPPLPQPPQLMRRRRAQAERRRSGCVWRTPPGRTNRCRGRRRRLTGPACRPAAAGLGDESGVILNRLGPRAHGAAPRADSAASTVGGPR